MRASVASLSKKFVNAVFAATLALGLVPAAAFADVADAAENSDAASAAVLDEDQTQSTSEFEQSPNNVILSGEGEALGAEESPGSENPDAEAGSQDEVADIPALDVINQDVALETVVAQAESTRSFFLAQTLESTRTVPIVSAKLPLDTGSNANVGASTDASPDIVGDASGDSTDQPDGSSEDEGGEDSDDPDLEEASQEDSVAARLVWQPAEHTGLSPDSVVVGSFTYLGMTYAMEPGGETVALVAVDYNQLPEEFVQRQVIVIPEAAETSDGDMFSVTRIADGAFTGLTAESANPDYLGCELLFAEAENSDAASAAIDNDRAAQGTAPAVSTSNDSQDGEPATPVILSDSEESGLPSNSAEGACASGGDGDQQEETDIRTIISMDGDIATLDDGSTYAFTNPFAGKPGILAVGIPASVSSIGDGAFEGAGTLQYLVVDEENPNFASYDGALYSADLTQLRLIPEGRVGAVCVASSAASVDAEVFSHCPLALPLAADAAAEASTIFPMGPGSFLESGIKRCISCKLTSDNNAAETNSRSLFEAVPANTLTVQYVYGGTQLKTEKPSSTESVEYVMVSQSYGFTSVNFINSENTSIWSSTLLDYSMMPEAAYYYTSSGSSSIGLGQFVKTPSGAHTVQVWVTDKPKSTITWNGAGGTPSQSSSEIYTGDTIDILPTCSRTGYTFTGWFTQASGGSQIIAGTQINNSATYYAHWSANTYRLTVDLRGGTHDGSYGPLGLDVITGTGNWNRLPVPVNAGFVFNGYYTASSGGTQVYDKNGACVKGTSYWDSSEAYIYGADLTVYARWTQTPIYTITLDGNNGSGGTSTMYLWYGKGWYTTSSPTDSTTAATSIIAPARAGYTFKGYSTSSTATSGSYWTSTSTMPSATEFSAATNLYAVWEANTITLTWNSQGGSSVSNTSKTYASGATVPMPSSNPTKTGYDFKGWYTSASGGTQVTASTALPSSNTTYHALWTPVSYTISYTLNGGSASNTGSYTIESNEITLTNPTKAGYTFTGWSGTGLTGSANMTVKIPKGSTGNKSYEAHWSDAISYGITYNLSGGSVSGTNPTAYTVESNEITLINPTKPGYNFTGWTGTGLSSASTSVKIPKGSTGTRTYTANWSSAISYGITYNLNGGSVSGNPGSYTVESGVITLKNPTKTGYTFKGWSGTGLSGDANTSVTIPAGQTGARSYEAHWTPVTHTIVLHANGGTVTGSGWSQVLTGGTATGDYQYTYDPDSVNNATTLTLPSISKAGYRFRNYSGSYVSNDVFTYQFTSDASQARYEITANFDIIPLSVPAGGTKVQLEDNAVLASSNVGTYAEGITDFAISFDYEGGTLPTITAKNAYVFDGWTADTACLVDGLGNAVDNTVPHTGVSIKKGLLGTSDDLPSEIVAHFSYKEFPLYVKVNSADADLDGFSPSGWREVTDASTLSSLGVSGTWKAFERDGGYKLSDAAAGIDIPQPEPGQGMAFAGWQDSQGESYAAEFDKGVFKPALSPADKAVTFRLFTATFEQAPYSVQFTVEDPAFVDAVNVAGATMNELSLVVKNDNLKSAGGVQVSDVALNADYYTADGFKRFVIDREIDADGWTVENGKSWACSFTLDYANITKYFPDGPGGKALEVAIELNDEPFRGDDGEIVYPVTAYTVTLDLDGGKLADATDRDFWGEKLQMSFTHRTSNNVDLPVPTRFGWRFAGWQGSFDQSDRGDLMALGNEFVAGTTRLLPGRIYSRTYKALWTRAQAYVKFDYNAEYPSASEEWNGVPSQAYRVTFGLGMNAGGSDISNVSAPTRPGYQFVGFYDTPNPTGGNCYYDANLASVRDWDKDDGTDNYTCTLWARWMKVTPGMNLIGGTVVDSDNAWAVLSAKSEKTGEVETAFSAKYNGLFSWTTYQPAATATRPDSTDEVSVALNSYDLDGFDLEGVPALFDYERDGVSYRLLGFTISSGSNSTFVPFVDLLRGRGFQFKVFGADLRNPGQQPSFELRAASVTAVYTQGNPGYTIPFGGEDDTDPTIPDDGETVSTIFNAGEGQFSNGSNQFTQKTTWHEGASPAVPTAPTRKGYVFKGWSLTGDEHVAGSRACDCKTEGLDALTSRIPVIYYAHWEAKSSNVRLVEWDSKWGGGAPKTHNLGTVFFGQMLDDLNDRDLMPSAREGLAFKGYFDEAGEIQYIGSDGTPVRAWDIESSANFVNLYAKWEVSTQGADPIEPETVDPSDPDPSPDVPPFPGSDDDYKSIPTDPVAALQMPVANDPLELGDDAGPEEMLFDGEYDGVMRFTVQTESDARPRDASPDANVQLTIYSYEPGMSVGAADSRTAVERVRKAFEDWAAAQPGRQAKYLQGFRVVSTGWNIALADLLDGKKVTVQCMGSDLMWDDGDFSAPPAAKFREGAVVAVYSTTPVVDPGYEEWPVSDTTQVLNRFDAGVGWFGSESSPSSVRMQTVASAYDGELKLPETDPVYPYLGYKFVGWVTVDDNGNKVDAADIDKVTWSSYRTFVAKYERDLFSITLKPGQGTGEEQVIEGVWDGEPITPGSSLYEKLAQAARPALAGHSFEGWYWNDGGTLRPYYLVSDDGYNAVLKVDNAYSDVRELVAWFGESDYTVVWNYNHGTKWADAYDFSKDTVTWPNEKVQLTYGCEVSESDFPVPDTPRRKFTGWYATSATATMKPASAATLISEVAGAGKLFQPVEGKPGVYAFMPPAGSSDTTFNFYAGWGEPIDYTIKLHLNGDPAGVAGPVAPTMTGADSDGDGDASVLTIGNAYERDSSSGEVTVHDVYAMADELKANSYGWQFVAWVDADGNEFPRQEIVSGTGDYELWAKWQVEQFDDGEGYKVWFLKGDEIAKETVDDPDYLDWWFPAAEELILVDRASQDFDAAAGTVELPEFVDGGDVADETVGFTFEGWQRVTLERDDAGNITGWSDMDESVDLARVAKSATTIDRQTMVNAAARAGSRELAFRAIWTPKEFEVRYAMLDSDGTYQYMDEDRLAEANRLAAYDQKVLLPEPQFDGVGRIFYNWDRRDFRVSNRLVDLVPGCDDFTVRELVKKVGKSAVSVEDGSNVLTLYGGYAEGMSFTVPLSVTIKFDPESPEDSMIAGEAKMEVNENGTSSPVRVESVRVDLMSGADDAFDQSGSYRGNEVDLLVQAWPEKDGKPDESKVVRFNLGESGKVYSGEQLAAAGFENFAKGSGLRIDYRLARVRGLGTTTFSAFQNLLAPTFLDTGDSMEIAKLFYTVGLARGQEDAS